MNMNYYLDLTDDYTWVIKSDTKRFLAGKDKTTAISLIERLNKAHRPNIEQRGAELWVCWNNHERHEECNYIREI